MENVESASPFTYSRYWLANLRPNVLTTLNKFMKEALQHFSVKKQLLKMNVLPSLSNSNSGKCTNILIGVTDTLIRLVTVLLKACRPYEHF